MFVACVNTSRIRRRVKRVLPWFMCILTTKVWEIRASDMHIDPNAVLELFDLEAAVQTVAFDGTGKLLAAGSEDGMVAVWDVSTGSLVAT